MPFTLHVTISGLCLFRWEGNVMHVLLPSTHGRHEHEACVLYDEGHWSGSGKITNRLRGKDLKGQLLTFDVPVGAIDPTLPAEIRDPGKMAGGRKLKPGNLGKHPGPHPGPEVAAHVALQAGCVTGYCPGVKWSANGGPPQYMALMVRWTVANVPNAQLTVQLGELTGNGSDSVKLTPIKDAIDVYVLHVPTGTMPRKTPLTPKPPKLGEKADHFAAYGDLLDPGPPVPVPECKDDKPAPCRARAQCIDQFSDLPRGGTGVLGTGPIRILGIEYSCMVGRAD